MYVTGVLGLDERRDGDGAAFVTDNNRRSSAAALERVNGLDRNWESCTYTCEITAYTIAFLEWRQTDTFTIFFSVILLTRECTGDPSPANASCMSR